MWLKELKTQCIIVYGFMCEVRNRAAAWIGVGGRGQKGLWGGRSQLVFWIQHLPYKRDLLNQKKISY